jgi:hypothetical protein
MQFDLTANMANFKQKRRASALNGLKPRWGAVALACVIASGGWRVNADEAQALEYKVKAAFIVKFAMFVEWPASARSAGNEPFTIGILGQDPFGKDFDEAIKNERVNHRPVSLRRARELSELEGCQAIFISASESKRLAELLRGVERKPVLIVGEETDFAKHGGMIGFIKAGGKLRFEINLAAAERAGLKLSAKLLQIGKVIVPGKSGREG